MINRIQHAKILALCSIGIVTAVGIQPRTGGSTNAALHQNVALVQEIENKHHITSLITDKSTPNEIAKILITEQDAALVQVAADWFLGLPRRTQAKALAVVWETERGMDVRMVRQPLSSILAGLIPSEIDLLGEILPTVLGADSVVYERFQQWFLTDQADCLAWMQAHDRNQIGSFAEFCFNKWAEKEPAVAWSRACSLPEGTVKSAAVVATLQHLATSDLTAALERLFQLTKGGPTEAAMAEALIDRTAATAPKLIGECMLQHPEWFISAGNDNIAGLSQWSENDPVSFQGWLSDHKDELPQKIAMAAERLLWRVVLEKQQGAALAESLKALPEERQVTGLDAILNRSEAFPAKTFTDFIQAIGDTPLRAKIIDKLVQGNFARFQTDQLIANFDLFRPALEQHATSINFYRDEEKIVSRLSPAFQAKYAEMTFYRALRRADFEVAFKLAQNAPFDDPVMGYEELASKVAEIHPQGVLAWVEKQPAGNTKDYLTCNLVYSWAKSDWDNCSAWVTDLLPGKAKDLALERLIDQCAATGNTSAALGFLAQMQPGDRSLNAASDFVRVMSDNPAAAEAFVQKLRFSESDSKQLRSLFQGSEQ
jgi:hypothetical protein